MPSETGSRLYSTPTTIKESFTSTSTTPLYSSTNTDGVPGGVPQTDGVGTTTTTSTSAKAKGGEGISSYSTTTSHSGDLSSTTTSPFIEAVTDHGVAPPITEDATTEPGGLPEIFRTTTFQPPSSSGSLLPSSSSVIHLSSTSASVQLSGVLLQTTQPLPNGESPSVLPSSSPLCDTADPSAAPSTCLHDPPSSPWPLLSTSASDSEHAATALFSSKDPASPSSTLPRLPHPSLPLSGRETDSVFPGVRFDGNDSDGDFLSGSTSTSVFGDTPPLQTVSDPSGTTESPESSWDPPISTISLSLSPTLQTSVLLSSDFALSGSTPGRSHSFSVGVEDARYAKGSTIESFLPEISGDGFPLASDVDALCGCSLEPSVSTSWLHASPHVPLPASAWDSASLELYSSVGFSSTSGVENLLRSTTVSDSLSLYQLVRSAVSPSPHSHLLPSTHSDPPVSVAATEPGVRDSWSSASDDDDSSALPASPTATLGTPTPDGQVLDTSSSASGSALFPDALEDVDQEWDRVQSSAFEENALPYSTEAATTVPTSDQSGHTSDDLDERTSAFYFENESGSAVTSGAGGATTPAVPVVTSAAPWSLGGEEESGSGQGENLYDNETSSDFSISEHAEKESEEQPVAGKIKKPCRPETWITTSSGRQKDD